MNIEELNKKILPGSAEIADSMEDMYLTFKMGSEEYGLEIKHVIEIIVMQQVTGVPDMPNFIMGVVNLRGKVIPVIDVRLRFNLEWREYDDRTCIVVVNIDDYFVGLVVDQVSEVVEILPQEIEQVSKSQFSGQEYLKGLGKIGSEIKILLDVAKVVGIDTMDAAAEVL
ncbi:MAG: purine-binding chemotaxis protein CheW [Deltaproteobacteria bacterium]|nr:purine-binding chemotaxis protein CheW [Deltaproteobacteria bacterium]